MLILTFLRVFIHMMSAESWKLSVSILYNTILSAKNKRKMLYFLPHCDFI